MADGTLDVKPLPSLQLYSACHPYLDTLNAAFFEKRIPDFVVCEMSAGGCGHFINYPRMWTALLENYESVEGNARFVLMSRRNETRVRPKPTIALLNRFTVMERLRAVFLCNPMEYAALTSEVGEQTRSQLVRGNQGVAFPLELDPV